MKYTEAQYIENNTTKELVAINCSIDGTPSTVPTDPDNCDYQQMMALVEKGDLIIAAPQSSTINT